jgi:Thermostable hemolysin
LPPAAARADPPSATTSLRQIDWILMLKSNVLNPAAKFAYRLSEHVEQGRAEVEAFIRQRFHLSYGARLESLMPRLFTLADTAGATLCAFGLREAAQGPLFMEHYLDEPVERAIEAHAGVRVPRRLIVEVGNLVAEPGGARAMIVMLTRYLHEAGFEWVVFTGVASLRAAFLRLGLRPFVLAPADPRRLSAEELAAWGRYFTARPQVMGGQVAAGIRTLTSDWAARDRLISA